VVSADVRVSHLSLDQLHAEGRPQVLDGAIDARITLEGSGDSVHQIAAGANGKLTAVLPEGAVRSSLAESAGLDLNSLGLLATRSQRETAIRC
ncbi:AsmA family protein, partial [Acinetobacter baumannii]